MRTNDATALWEPKINFKKSSVIKTFILRATTPGQISKDLKINLKICGVETIAVNNAQVHDFAFNRSS